MARYQKLNSELGYVDDVADIEFLKFQNLRHVVLGNMLGDFDIEGNYIVEPEIVRELISMKKYVVDTIDNIDICTSELKLDKPINFFVTFEGERATLSLVEKMSYNANFKTNSGLYSDINEYILDQVETSGVVDKTILYKRWNISETSGNYLDVFNMDEDTIASLYNIVNKFKTNLVSNQILMEKEEEIEEIEAGYAVEIMEILTHYPKLKTAVDTEIKKMLTENSEMIKIDKPYFAKTLNEIITQKIDENINVLNEKEKADFKSEARVAKVNYNNNVRDKLDIVETKVDNVEPTLEIKTPTETKKPTVILDTFKKEERSLEECAKGFIDAEKKTNERLKNDAVVAITGYEIVDETGKPKENDKSMLATAVLGAVATGVAISTGVAAVGAVAGVGLELANASNRAKLLGAVLTTGLGIQLARHVGEKTKREEEHTKTIVGLTKAIEKNETAQTSLDAKSNAKSSAKTKPEVKKAGRNKSAGNKSASKSGPSKNKGKGNGKGVEPSTSIGRTHSDTSTSLIGKTIERIQEPDYNSQKTGIGVEPKKFKQTSVGDKSTKEKIVLKEEMVNEEIVNDLKTAERYRKRRLERLSLLEGSPLINQQKNNVAGSPTIVAESPTISTEI